MRKHLLKILCEERERLSPSRCCYSSGIPLLNIILSNEVECFTGTWFVCLKITWDLQTDKCYCFSGDRLSSFLQPSSIKTKVNAFLPDGLHAISVTKDLKEYFFFGYFNLVLGNHCHCDCEPGLDFNIWTN